MEAHKDDSTASPFEYLLEGSGDAVHGQQHFTPFDYGLFGVMLLLSAAIGIYFGFFAKRKQNNTTEYLLGGKKMTFFPIAASLIASHINGFTMLAVPAEVYAHGSEYSLCVISAVLVSSPRSILFKKQNVKFVFVECAKQTERKRKIDTQKNLFWILDGLRFDLRVSSSIL
jgi:Sodium:solute symporter family